MVNLVLLPLLGTTLEDSFVDYIYKSIDFDQSMKNKRSFFSSRNTIMDLTTLDIQQTDDYLKTIEAFARTTYESMYVIDYQKKTFEYVSDNPLFLCGRSAQEVKAMGYDFYFEHVPEEDLQLLLMINTVGFDFFETIPLEDRRNYTISYDFHLIPEKDKRFLIHQKLTPIFLTEKGKIWKALCVVSLSSRQSSGNIRIRKKNSTSTFQYDLEGKYWKNIEKERLSERESEILRYSIRGFSIQEIAELLFISPDTVKFHRRKLFEKLQVSNISEAIAYVTDNKLL